MFFTKTWGGYWQEKMREQMEGLFHVQGHTKNYRNVPSQDSSDFQKTKLNLFSTTIILQNCII